MKALLNYIILVLMTLPGWLLLSCDNDEISSAQADAFVKYYGAGMKDMGMQVLTLDDGYLIMANVETPGRGQDISVIRTDRYGNSVQDPVMIGGKFKDHGTSMKANDAGYIIAGSTRKSDNGYTNAYIVQLNAEASEVVWELDTGFTNNDEALDIYIHEDGDIAVCGYTEIDLKGKNVLLIELNFVDDTMLVNMGNYGLADDEVANIVSYSGDRYLFAGYASMPTGNTSGISRRLFALKWDGTSDLGEPSYRTIESNNTEIVDIIKYAEDEFYLACRAENIESSESYIQVATLNSSSWRWEFPENLQFGERTRNRVNEMKISGNQLYLSGTSSSAGSRGDMFVLQTDMDGANATYLYQGDGSSYEGMSFDITPDRGFILTGAVYTGEQSAIALSKLR